MSSMRRLHVLQTTSTSDKTLGGQCAGTYFSVKPHVVVFTLLFYVQGKQTKKKQVSEFKM